MGECFFVEISKITQGNFSQKKGIGGVFLTKVEKYSGTFLMVILDMCCHDYFVFSW